MDKKVYNKFPEDFKVPELKKGERAAFELVGTQKPPHILPLSETVDIDGTLVDIAVIRSQTADGEMKLHPIMLSSKIVYLNGNKLLNRKIYTQMMLSNHRADNKNADESKVKIYKVYDPAGDARKANLKRLELVRAQAVVAEMTEKEIRQYFDVKGESSDGDLDILTARLLDIAEKSPKAFVKNKGLDSKEKLLDVFVQANKQKIIKFDVKESYWVWADTGDKILQIPRQLEKGQKRTDFFIPFLGEDKGKEVYARLKGLLESEE